MARQKTVQKIKINSYTPGANQAIYQAMKTQPGRMVHVPRCQCQVWVDGAWRTITYDRQTETVYI